LPILAADGLVGMVAVLRADVMAGVLVDGSVWVANPITGKAAILAPSVMIGAIGVDRTELERETELIRYALFEFGIMGIGDEQ
jgi:hypothetical protein